MLVVAGLQATLIPKVWSCDGWNQDQDAYWVQTCENGQTLFLEENQHAILVRHLCIYGSSGWGGGYINYFYESLTVSKLLCLLKIAQHNYCHNVCTGIKKECKETKNREFNWDAMHYGNDGSANKTLLDYSVLSGTTGQWVACIWDGSTLFFTHIF